MFHAIIVDDEQTIRDGIAKHIKRKFPNITIDGIFSNGKYAIDFLSSNSPDIVITDIKMSLKNGIDIAKYVFENIPSTKIILISGYQEFEYAKQAINYNVNYYLSKPVKVKELDNAIDELISQLKTEMQAHTLLEQEKQRFENLLTIIKKDFYTDILLGILPDKESIVSRAKKLSLTDSFLADTQISIVSISTKNTDIQGHQTEELYNYIIRLLSEIKGFVSAIPIIQESHQIYFVIELKGFDNLNELRSCLENELHIMVISGLELLNIDLCYEINYCCFDIFSLVQYRNPSYGTFSNNTLLEEKCKELLSKIVVHNRQEAQEIWDSLRQRTKSMSVSESYQLLVHLFSKIYDNFAEPLEISENFEFSPKSNHEALFLQGDKVLNDIFDNIPSDSQKFADIAISRAKEYIEEHLSESINLEDVAGFVYLSPAYFSRFFKQHTSMTMTEYLIQRRMQLAKDLLKNRQNKIHEVSALCGYRSHKYFTKVFKQYTGYTPSEYIHNLS